jgi:hypothetical protein
MGSLARCRSEWSGSTVLIPGLLSGLIFPLALGLAMQQAYPGEPVMMGTPPSFLELLQILLVLVTFSMIASAVGLALSAVPLVVGVWALAMLGEWNAGTRHPAFWALAGGMMPAAAILAIGLRPDESASPAFILTGAACAVLARRSVHWEEPPPLAR